MSGKRLRSGIFLPTNWRGRACRLAMGVVAVLLVSEALAARTKAASAPSTETNRTVASATGEFNPQLLRSAYKPNTTRDPFMKLGSNATGGGAFQLAAGPGSFHLQAILWSPANPSAVVNNELLDLNKSVILSTASGNMEVKAVEITQERVVLEVAGQRVELKLNPNPEQPAGKPPK